ncbi:MAG: glycosyltransferase [Nitrospirae bacterium]|nr:MAG: glycosyltransferase [Nitrospirota bacterium]
MKRLSFVIPVFNSEKTIGTLCEKLIAYFSSEFSLEIVLVNDASTDNSDAVCRQLQAGHNDIISYIRLSKNFGEHNAVMAGLNHVSGDYCVTIDDDLQNPPEEVGKLIYEIQKGYDVVYSYYENPQMSFFRRIGSRFNDKMANILLKKPADLYLSSFKVMNGFLAREIIKYTGPDPYIDGIILRVTSNIGRVKVEHRGRVYARSGYTFGKLVSLWGNMAVSFSLYPIRALGILGFIMMIVGCYSILESVVRLWTPLKNPSDYEFLVDVTAFYRGIQLFAIGVVGEYIGRIYMSIKRDPQFIIREILPSKTCADSYMSDHVGRNERRRCTGPRGADPK